MRNATQPRPAPLLTTEEAATLLNLSPATLNTLRCRGGGPPYIKVGTGRHGRVRYREADILAWIDARAQHSTAGSSSASAASHTIAVAAHGVPTDGKR